MPIGKVDLDILNSFRDMERRTGIDPIEELDRIWNGMEMALRGGRLGEFRDKSVRVEELVATIFNSNGGGGKLYEIEDSLRGAVTAVFKYSSRPLALDFIADARKILEDWGIPITRFY